jgi:hypothetical protein
MTPMRTPDSDDTGSGDAASLAEGFGTIDTDPEDDTSDGADGFGMGDTTGDQVSALEGTDGAGAETGAYDFDPADVSSSDDYDLTGDGAVDQADFDEALHSLFNFGVDEVAADHHDDGGDQLAAGGHDDDGGAADVHHDDLGGFF